MISAEGNKNTVRILHKNSVRASQETHGVSTTEFNRLMLFEETGAVYCDNYMKHTNTLCGQNAEFLYVEGDGTYSNHWALNG
jgi:hypothetical protein